MWCGSGGRDPGRVRGSCGGRDSGLCRGARRVSVRNPFLEWEKRECSGMVHRFGETWVFTLIRPRAHRVYLVGDFNAWSTTAVAMDRLADGRWAAVLELGPGVYRFRYYADGVWLTDFAAFGVERNRSGQFDSVLWVPAGAAEKGKGDAAISEVAVVPGSDPSEPRVAGVGAALDTVEPRDRRVVRPRGQAARAVDPRVLEEIQEE